MDAGYSAAVFVFAVPMFACAVPDGKPFDTSAAAESTGVPPAWDAERLEEAITSAAALPAPGPLEIRDAYLTLMAAGDPDCPGSPDQLLGVDLRGCTAASGVRYAGVCTYTSDPNGGFILSGDFEIIDADGTRFIGGGAASSGVWPEADAPWDVRITGLWGWDGQPGWLGTGIGAYLTEGGGTKFGLPYLELDGGLTYGGVSFWFDRLTRSGGCDGLTGALRVRDPAGIWWVLDYGASCASCAALSVDGEAAGETCLDLTGWLDAFAAARAPR